MKSTVCTLAFALSLVVSVSSCSGNGSNQASNQPSLADTIFMGDLKATFEGDSVFFEQIAPHICLMQNQYLLTLGLSEAEAKGVSKALYRKVQDEIGKTNEIIKKGVMKGGDVKKIFDFQEHYTTASN